jgi:hypothetical protein
MLATATDSTVLGQISLTFYEQLLCPNPFAKNLQTQIVSTLKLRKKLLYEKAARKILVTLTPELTAYLPWPPWVTRHRWVHHVAHGGQGKFSSD